MSTEIWKDIPGFEKDYQVSNMRQSEELSEASTSRVKDKA